jgi:kynurenine 3-monooxygenase
MKNSHVTDQLTSPYATDERGRTSSSAFLSFLAVRLLSTKMSQDEIVSEAHNKVVISGAGLVGCLTAIYMAKRGFQVELYEGRPDSRKLENQQGRSINLALSNRAFRALGHIDPNIVKQVHDIGMKMYGRYIHLKNGQCTFQPYGREDQYILSVSRRFLNEYLLSRAEELPNVKVHFSEKVSGMNLALTDGTVKVQTKAGNEVRCRFIVGADGVHSVVRQTMQEYGKVRFQYLQQYITHAYKELTIGAIEGREGNDRFKLRNDSLHIWPRGDFMIIALPNPTGDFTATVFMRMKSDPSMSPYSFETLNTDEKVLEFFKTEFPDFYAITGDSLILQDWHENPTSGLMHVKCDPYHLQDKCLLLGDSAHAIIPFYGQGVNCGFEDVYVLNQIMDKYSKEELKQVLGQVLAEYTRIRKPSCDAISDLSKYNFIEMCSRTASYSFLITNKISNLLHRLIPKKYLPLYTMVTFTPEMPYDEAWSRHLRREIVVKQVSDILSWVIIAGTVYGSYRYLKQVANSPPSDSTARKVVDSVWTTLQKFFNKIF